MEEPENPKEPVLENLDDVMEGTSFDEDNSVDDFYDELDAGIDNYFQNLRKKK